MSFEGLQRSGMHGEQRRQAMLNEPHSNGLKPCHQHVDVIHVLRAMHGQQHRTLTRIQLPLPAEVKGVVVHDIASAKDQWRGGSGFVGVSTDPVANALGLKM